MADYYKTDDGKVFETRREAQAHADDRARFAAQMDQIHAEVDAEKNAARAKHKKLVEEGRRLAEEQKYDEAIAVLNRADAVDVFAGTSDKPHRNGDVYTWLGRCYIAKKDLDLAVKYLNTAIYGLSPDAVKEFFIAPNINIVPAVFLWRGFALENLGHRDNAIADYKAAADWGWYNNASYREKGFKDLDYWELTDALKQLKKMGVEYTPQVPQIMPRQWGYSTPKDSSYLSISTASVTVEPEKKRMSLDEIKILFDSASAAFEKEEYAKAMEEYTKISESGDREYEGYGYYFRGIIHHKTGSSEEAIVDFKKAIEMGIDKAAEFLKIAESTPITPPTVVEHKFDNGDVYEGEVVNGKMHGKGKYTYANGIIDEGKFFAGTMVKGKCIYPGGVVKEGDFAEGELVKGKYTYADGTTEEGEFVDTKLVKGRYTYSDGDFEEGGFIDGKLNGKGKKLYNGENYEGDLVDGDYHGKGKLTDEDGFTYEGEFAEGYFHGKGKLIDEEGDVYEGEFVEGDFSGLGKKTSKDGTVEYGKWEEGELIEKLPLPVIAPPKPHQQVPSSSSMASAAEANKAPGKKSKWVRNLIIIGIAVNVLYFIGERFIMPFFSENKSTESGSNRQTQTASETSSIAGSIVSPNTGWTATVDGGNAAVKNSTSANITFGRETIQNREAEVMTLTVNLARGTEWRIGEFTLDNNSFVQQFKTSNGIKFSVLGDGENGWRVMFPTSQTLSDNCYHETVFSTVSGRVTQVDIPFSRLAQPDWGRRVTFNRNNIVSIKIQRHSTDSNFSGASTIKIFGFETY